ADMGVKVSEEVESALGQIREAINKVADLVREVSTASDEQARGSDQINTAVSQMDQVTQANAANAEQSAAASEQLAAQATELGRMVRDLMSVVQGGLAVDGDMEQLEQRHAEQRFLEHEVKGNGRSFQPAEQQPHPDEAGPASESRSLRDKIGAERADSKAGLPAYLRELNDRDFKEV
ncbi:MAG: hypothetical protein GWO03_04705, partial [Gammaproteobacteria bacterium]|nr:hypothetical protein [Gammaproteobacteria bacterium]